MAGHKLKWFTHLHMVAHSSTNRARHRVTLLIETNVLPLSQAATGRGRQHTVCQFTFSSATVSFIYKPVLLPTLFQNLGELVQLPQPDSDIVIERLVVNPHLSLGVRQRRLFHHHITHARNHFRRVLPHDTCTTFAQPGWPQSRRKNSRSFPEP